MKTIILTTLALLPFIQSFSQDARQISENAAETIEIESSEMIATLNIFDGKGNMRKRQVVTASKRFGSVTKTMIRFLSPADVKGTSMLIYDDENKDDDMWIYLPSLRKSRRIISNEKGKSFMGSEFSNADMSRPNPDDFIYKFAGIEILDGSECWKIEMLGKNRETEDNYGFSKKIMWIEKNTFLTRKIEFYGQKGIPVKDMTLGDYRKQGNGKYFAFRMEMKNLMNNRKSEMIIDKMQLGSQLSENSFSVASLEK